DLRIQIGQGGIGDPVVLFESQRGPGFVTHVDADEAHTLLAVVLADLLQVRSLLAAGRAGGVPDVDHQQLAALFGGGELFALIGGAGERARLVTVGSRDFRGHPFSGDVPGVVAVTGVVAAGGQDRRGQHPAAGGEQATPTGPVCLVHVSFPPVTSPAPSWSEIGRASWRDSGEVGAV